MRRLNNDVDENENINYGDAEMMMMIMMMMMIIFFMTRFNKKSK